MILDPYCLDRLSRAPHLMGDERSGRAAIVQPQRDIHQYDHDAQSPDREKRHVFLTHPHAEFLAGPFGLRDAVSATVHHGAAARPVEERGA